MKLKRFVLLIGLIAMAMGCSSSSTKKGAVCSSTDNDCPNNVCAETRCATLCNASELSAAGCTTGQTCVKYDDNTGETDGPATSCVDSNKVTLKSSGREDASNGTDGTVGTEDTTSGGTREEMIQKFCEENIKVCPESSQPQIDSCKKSFADNPSVMTPTQMNINCARELQSNSACPANDQTCCACWTPLFGTP